MKKTLFFLPLLSFFCYGQVSQNIDSLKFELNDSKTDETKARLYLEISEAAWGKNFDTIIKYTHLAYDLIEKKLSENPSDPSKKLYSEYLAHALNNIGFEHYTKGNTLQAFDYYKNAIKIQEEINDKEQLPNSLNNIAILYEDNGDINHAIEYFDKAVTLLKEMGDKNSLAPTYYNLGHLYSNKEDWNSAEKVYLNALNCIENSSEKSFISELQTKLGIVYYHKGDTVKALAYYNKALATAEQIKDNQLIAVVKNKLAVIFQNKGDYKKAAACYDEVIKLLKKEDKQGLTITLHNYAGLFLKQKNLIKSETYAYQALTLARETNSLTSIRDGAEILCSIYKKQNKIEKAQEICELFRVMNDSVNKIDSERNNAFAKFKKEYEEHENQLKISNKKEEAKQIAVEQNKGHNTFTILISILLSVALIIYLIKRFK